MDAQRAHRLGRVHGRVGQPVPVDLAAASAADPAAAAPAVGPAVRVALAAGQAVAVLVGVPVAAASAGGLEVAPVGDRLAGGLVAGQRVAAPAGAVAPVADPRLARPMARVRRRLSSPAARLPSPRRSSSKISPTCSKSPSMPSFAN
jgi:hypothetical protein